MYVALQPPGLKNSLCLPGWVVGSGTDGLVATKMRKIVKQSRNGNGMRSSSSRSANAIACAQEWYGSGLLRCIIYWAVCMCTSRVDSRVAAHTVCLVRLLLHQRALPVPVCSLVQAFDSTSPPRGYRADVMRAGMQHDRNKGFSSAVFFGENNCHVTLVCVGNNMQA